MTINAYRAKKALIELLQANTNPGDYLAGVNVGYSWRPDLGGRCVYGGFPSFTHEPSAAENPGLLVRENTTINLYIKAADSPPSDVETTDAAVDDIVAGIGALLKANPKFGGGFSWTGILSGLGDHSDTDDQTASRMLLRIGVSTQLTYGA